MDAIQTDHVEIEKLIRRVEVAENRHDVDAMLKEMVADPLLHVCGVPPVKGQEALKLLYREFFKTFVSTRITSQQIYVSSSGDMAWEYGAYVNEFEGPSGRIHEQGKYLGIYHKIAGEWKGAAFCITPNGG